jgi:catechol 2,3-dioxygenase-like lactoylglutathione lyase family enzyme
MRLLAAMLAAGLMAGCISVDVDSDTVRAAEPVYEGPLQKRTALVVADMNRAMAFYRDVLGFQGGTVTQSGPNSYSYEVFNLPRDKPIRFATMDAGPNQTRALALIESPGVRHDPNGARESAMVVNANGKMDAMLEGARRLGLTIIPERPLNSVDGRVGREVAIIDADGHLVVLYQFPGGPDSGDKR